jgi:hypothetical protein
MDMSSRPLPQYSYDRAFVVQFAEGSGPGTEGFTGRAEHLGSGRRNFFGSPEALFEFMRSILADVGES